MLRFPLRLFPPAQHKPFIANVAVSGGQPIIGVAQTADLSAGGVWIYELDLATIRSAAQIATLRALVAELQSGVTPIEIPVLDILQPWPGGARGSRTPFSDLSAFSDTGEFETDPIVASLEAAAYMPASPAPPVAPTQATLTLTSAAPLNAGELFSLIGPSGNVRMHLVTSIVSVVGTATTVTVKPPFREDMPAGTLVDFNDPRFTAKLDPTSAADAWASFRTPFLGEGAKLRFIESGFPGG